MLRVSVGEHAAPGKEVRALATLAPDEAFSLPLLRDEPGLICFQPAPGASHTPLPTAQLKPTRHGIRRITEVSCLHVRCYKRICTTRRALLCQGSVVCHACLMLVG